MNLLLFLALALSALVCVVFGITFFVKNSKVFEQVWLAQQSHVGEFFVFRKK